MQLKFYGKNLGQYKLEIFFSSLLIKKIAKNGNEMKLKITQ